MNVIQMLDDKVAASLDRLPIVPTRIEVSHFMYREIMKNGSSQIITGLPDGLYAFGIKIHAIKDVPYDHLVVH
jgi:hypothetical protein